MSAKVKIIMPLKHTIIFSFTGSLIGLLLITNSALIPFSKFNNRYKVGNYKKTDLQLMHEWIQSNTPVKARIISFPEDDSFLCEAKRICGWIKAIIHEPKFMFDWYEKINKFYGISFNDFDCDTRLLNVADSLYLQSDLRDVPPC